jgi:catechol 2,3-dioxygenase-like lactoylglutathione lyase family enzyme
MKSLKSVCPLLQVADLDRSRAFYTGKLGFKETWKDPGGFTILSRDECLLFIAPKQREVDLRNATARLTNDGYANYDLHLDCFPGSLDALWKEYKEAGVEMGASFVNGPVTRDYGVRDFSVIDPDGYDLVFGESIASS